MQELIDQHARLVEQYSAQTKTMNQLKVNTLVWFEHLQAITETGNALLALTQRIERSQ